MRPNDRRAVLAALCGIVASAAFDSPLHAHSVLRTNGQVIIGANRLVVTLDVSPEDFAHLYGLAPTADGTVSRESIVATTRLHADELTASLELWDESGRRLNGEPFRWDAEQQTSPTVPWGQLRMMRTRYSASFDLPDRSRYLTFRMNPAEQGVAIARQWVIDVGSPEGSASQTLRLTSRGNAETVELQWGNLGPRLRGPSNVPNEALACAPLEDQQAARFREIYVDLEKTPDELSVRITVPLVLLGTWIPVPRRIEGRVEPDEQAALLQAVHALMSSALDFKVGGKPLSADSLTLRVLGVNPGSSENSGPLEPVGFFTSLLEVRQRYATAGPVGRLTLTWRLMNSVVLAARVALRANGQCTPREFSSYAPALEW